MNTKLIMITVLMLVLVTLGIGKYTYTAAIIGSKTEIDEPTRDIRIAGMAENQPDWDSVVYKLSSDNVIHGDVPIGDLFIITPHSTHNGDLCVHVYLVNTGDLVKAYKDLDMQLYLENSVQAEDPNYRVLTMRNGVASFSIRGSISDNYTISVIGGRYSLNLDDPLQWRDGWSVTPELYCEYIQE